MRKSTGILAVVAAVAAAYVATTWYVGRQAEAAIHQVVSKANERMAQAVAAQPGAGKVRLAVAEYRRRVFSSDVVYSLQLQDRSGQGQEFLLSDHLQHGPFPLDAIRAGHVMPMLALSQARLLPSAAAQAWFDSLNGDTPVTGRTEVRFGGKATSEWAFKPLNIAQSGEVLKFSGGALRVALDNDFSDSRISGEFDLLDYSTGSESERVALGGVQFEYESGSEAARMHSVTRATRFDLEVAGSRPVSLRDAAMDVSTEQSGDLASGSVRYDFGEVHWGGEALGTMSVGARGRDVSMPALSDLTQVYNELSARHGPNEEDWQLSPEEAALLQEKLLALLAGNPVLTFEPVLWKNDEGESSASLTLELTRPAGAEQAASFEALLQQALRAVELNLHVERPMFVRAMAQLQGAAEDPRVSAVAGALYDEYVARLQAAGLAASADQASTAKIVYRDGRVDANGRQMSVTEFLQRALLALFM